MDLGKSNITESLRWALGGVKVLESPVRGQDAGCHFYLELRVGNHSNYASVVGLWIIMMGYQKMQVKEIW